MSRRSSEEPEDEPAGSDKKMAEFSRRGAGAHLSRPLICQVQGCAADLTIDTPVHCQRQRLCLTHARADVLLVDGQPHRLCYHCSTLQPLEDFDGTKRNCRQTLLRQKMEYQARKRKQSARAGAEARHGPARNAVVAAPARLALTAGDQATGSHQGAVAAGADTADSGSQDMEAGSLAVVPSYMQQQQEDDMHDHGLQQQVQQHVQQQMQQQMHQQMGLANMLQGLQQYATPDGQLMAMPQVMLAGPGGNMQLVNMGGHMGMNMGGPLILGQSMAGGHAAAGYVQLQGPQAPAPAQLVKREAVEGGRDEHTGMGPVPKRVRTNANPATQRARAAASDVYADEDAAALLADMAVGRSAGYRRRSSATGMASEQGRSRRMHGGEREDGDSKDGAYVDAQADAMVSSGTRIPRRSRSQAHRTRGHGAMDCGDASPAAAQASAHDGDGMSQQGPRTHGAAVTDEANSASRAKASNVDPDLLQTIAMQQQMLAQQLTALQLQSMQAQLQATHAATPAEELQAIQARLAVLNAMQAQAVAELTGSPKQEQEDVHTEDDMQPDTNGAGQGGRPSEGPGDGTADGDGAAGACKAMEAARETPQPQQCMIHLPNGVQLGVPLASLLAASGPLADIVQQALALPSGLSAKPATPPKPSTKAAAPAPSPPPPRRSAAAASAMSGHASPKHKLRGSADARQAVYGEDVQGHLGLAGGGGVQVVMHHNIDGSIVPVMVGSSGGMPGGGGMRAQMLQQQRLVYESQRLGMVRQQQAYNAAAMQQLQVQHATEQQHQLALVQQARDAGAMAANAAFGMQNMVLNQSSAAAYGQMQVQMMQAAANANAGQLLQLGQAANQHVLMETAAGPMYVSTAQAQALGAMPGGARPMMLGQGGAGMQRRLLMPGSAAAAAAGPVDLGGEQQQQRGQPMVAVLDASGTFRL